MYLNLRRQPGYRPVSSKVGDHLPILLGVVVHLFLLFFQRSRCSATPESDFGRCVLGCVHGYMCVRDVCFVCVKCVRVLCVLCVYVPDITVR